ncbi:hypothetical protein NECAME_17825, partial [Necator americanus]
VFLYRLSAKPCERGREFLASCDSCCSTLAYQLKSFKRQAPLGGFKTLSLLRAVVKAFHKPVELSHLPDMYDPKAAVPRPAKLYTKQEYSEKFILILEGRALVTIGQNNW